MHIEPAFLDTIKTLNNTSDKPTDQCIVNLILKYRIIHMFLIAQNFVSMFSILFKHENHSYKTLRSNTISTGSTKYFYVFHKKLIVNNQNDITRKGKK